MRIIIKKIWPVRMKIPLVSKEVNSKGSRLRQGNSFLVASREIEQIYSNLSNLSNLFPICLICTDLYDFCPLGHSFFSLHIAKYREHHFQSYLRIYLGEVNQQSFIHKIRSVEIHHMMIFAPILHTYNSLFRWGAIPWWTELLPYHNSLKFPKRNL